MNAFGNTDQPGEEDKRVRAMVIDRILSLADGDPAPLRAVDLPIPVPAPGEIRLRVTACGVCHTELDEIEGRTAPPAGGARPPGGRAGGRPGARGDPL